MTGPGPGAGAPAVQVCRAADPILARTGDLAVATGHVIAACPGDAAHEEARQRILAFCDRHPDALHRTCREGHLTGSAMVVDPASRRLLLLLHAKLGLWLQPGGHADGDAALPAVAWREATEETGIAGLRLAVPAIDLDVHRVDPPGEGPHLHLDARYLAVSPPGARPAGNHESHDLGWFELDELPGLGVDPGTLRLARRALAALAGLAGGPPASRG